MTRSHDLHVGNIKRVVGVIASYQKRVALASCASFGLSLAFPFVFCVMF
jgi:hypothetical protein